MLCFGSENFCQLILKVCQKISPSSLHRQDTELLKWSKMDPSFHVFYAKIYSDVKWEKSDLKYTRWLFFNLRLYNWGIQFFHCSTLITCDLSSLQERGSHPDTFLCDPDQLRGFDLWPSELCRSTPGQVLHHAPQARPHRELRCE